MKAGKMDCKSPLELKNWFLQSVKKVWKTWLSTSIIIILVMSVFFNKNHFNFRVLHEWRSRKLQDACNFRLQGNWTVWFLPTSGLDCQGGRRWHRFQQRWSDWKGMGWLWWETEGVCWRLWVWVWVCESQVKWYI